MKKILSVMLLSLFLLSAAVMPSTAAPTPVYGGKTVFKAADFAIKDEKNNGNFVSYRCTLETVKENAVDVVKVTCGNEAKIALIDFSYYQWNNSEYLPALKTTDYKFFKIKYKRADSDSSEFQFFKADEAALNATGASGQTTIKTENDGKWHTATIDLSAAKFTSTTAWTDKNIRQFRLYPWAQLTSDKNAGKVFYIEYFGFFKTQAEADAYAGPAEDAAKQAAAASTTAKAAATTAKAVASTSAKAPQTADLSMFAALPAAVSLLGAAFVSAKKRSR